MKKYSLKHRNHLLRKSIKGSKPKKRSGKRGTLHYRRKKEHKTVPVRLSAPDNLYLSYEQCENITGFVHRLKTASLSAQSIIIDLENVTEICDGSISMLLSVIKDVGNNGVKVRGTYPSNVQTRNFLEKSGFFDHIRGVISPENENSKNTIIRTGDSRTPPKEVSTEIYNSMETVWGEKGRNPLLRGGVFEMVRNSCDHAFNNLESVYWHFSVSHHESKKLVNYSFVDNGKGIIRTLNSKGFIDKLVTYFKNKSEILDAAYKDGIESATGLSWRGKGLPTIYELYEDKVISNLIVVTNNVFIDFERNLRKEIDFPFSGTYYHWVIDQNCDKYCFN